MLDLIKIIIGCSFLILISIIDFKTYNKRKGYIPSILTTLFLIMLIWVPKKLENIADWMDTVQIS